MVKEILSGAEARKTLLEGFKIVSDAVGSTLGPKGRNVVIQTGPINKTTKDGVTVAKNIELDGFINEGVKMIKQSSITSASNAGDGTTTTTILTYAIANEGYKAISSGANPIDLKRGIEYAVDKVVNYIKENSKEVKDLEQIQQVAFISANSDEEIGGIVADAYKQAGENGIIIVEDSKTPSTYIEKIEGLQFDKGYVSSYFINNLEKLTVEYDNPKILVMDSTYSNIKKTVDLLNFVIQNNIPLVIIADEFDTNLLSMLVANKLQAGLKVLPIKAPSYGDDKKERLRDIAILTGATLISDETGMNINSYNETMLGTCGKIISTKDKTTITGFNGADPKAVEDRIIEIKSQIEKAREDNNQYMEDKFKKRLASFTDGIFAIKVGGMDQLNIKEKKDRVDDALSATSSAKEEGIVVGAGVCLLKAIKILENENLGGDKQLGIEIIKKALSAPIRKILDNAGENSEFIIGKILEDEKGNFGYDAQNGKYCDLIENGIIDPAKVERIAIQSASSIATQMIMTNTIIIDKKEETKVQPNNYIG